MPGSNTTSRRWRETFVVLTFSVLLAGGVFLFLLLLGGGYFLAVLTVLAALAAVFGLHYLLWGRAFQRRATDQRDREGAWADSRFPPQEADEAAPDPRSPSQNCSLNEQSSQR